MIKILIVQSTCLVQGADDSYDVDNSGSWKEWVSENSLTQSETYVLIPPPPPLVLISNTDME